MQIIRVSATKARNEFFEILNLVSTGTEVIVEKDKKTIARITPEVSQKNKNKGLLRALKAASVGFIYSKKDNPLRRPGSADFLGKWER